MIMIFYDVHLLVDILYRKCCDPEVLQSGDAALDACSATVSRMWIQTARLNDLR